MDLFETFKVYGKRKYNSAKRIKAFHRAKNDLDLSMREHFENKNIAFETLHKHFSDSIEERLNQLNKDLDGDLSMRITKEIRYRPSFKQDNISELLLTSIPDKTMIPIVTTGDGSCFYNSLSLGLFGNETFSEEFRFRTALEIVLNYQAYLDVANFENLEQRDLFISFGIQGNTNNEPLAILREAYTGLIGWSGLVQVFGASTALRISIQQFYPNIETKLTRNVPIQRALVRPIDNPSEAVPKVNILWTHTQNTNYNDSNWQPNHFCLLINVNLNKQL
jgi:hypothetical protein